MQYYMYRRLPSTSRAKTLTLLTVGQFITLSSVLEIFLEKTFFSNAFKLNFRVFEG